MKPRKPLLIVPSVLFLAATASPEIIERVVAKVNGDIVTLSEFVARQAAAVQASRVPAERVERYLRENNARILQEAIDELLLTQRASELGLRLRPEYLQEMIESIKKENGIESDDALREQLSREGMSIDDLRRNIERSVLRRQVLGRELEARAGVSETEARSDYEARLAEYTQPARVRLQEILVARADGRDTLAVAGQLLARARAGEDFAALAREHSDAPTREAGGDLGTLNQGEMNPVIESELAALGPGDVSEPLATPEGYRIFRVVERTEGSVTPFDQVREEILRRLAQERYAQEYEAYIEGLRKSATIDVRVREVPLQVGPATLGSAPLTEGALPGEGAPVVPAPEPPAAAAMPDPAAEFETTPQARPERVAPTPPPVPGTPLPSPSPVPSPQARR
jgi:parvulin-like peptidyl-prolyl isomerase